MTNPLLTPWTAAFGLPPFAMIRDEDFGPAFDAGLAEARAAIAAIAGGVEAPSFANTVAAMEMAEAMLDRVGGVFYNLAGADSTEAREALMRDLAPKMSAFHSEVINNKVLFARVQAVWDEREAAGLAGEELRVLTLYRQMFLRAGAQLEGAAASRMTAVMSRLAVLGTQFGQNLLAEERGWMMPLAEGDLEGLPAFVVEAARAAGAEGAGTATTRSSSVFCFLLSFLSFLSFFFFFFLSFLSRFLSSLES